MPIPLATEKVLRTTLRALKTGGFLASDADVSIIENIPNNATDSDITTAVNSISFGGLVSGNGSLVSDDDVNIYVDANNDDDGTFNIRYFRVAQDQGSGAVTDPDRELFTVAAVTDLSTFPPKDFVTGVLGPRTVLGGGNATLNIGNNGTAYYLTLTGSYRSLLGNPGGEISSSLGLVFYSPSISVANKVSNISVGGWRDITTNPDEAKFVVGQDTTGNGLFIEQCRKGTPSNLHGVIRLQSAGGSPRLFIYGDDPANDNASYLLLGVSPNNLTYNDIFDFDYAPVSILGQKHAGAINRSVLLLQDQLTQRLGGSILTIKSDSNSTFPWYAIRIFYKGNAMFNVDQNGNVNINSTSSYLSGGADFAEFVKTDKTYEPGTVLVIRNGIYTASTSAGDKGTAGVVATQPGIICGTENIYNTEHKKSVTVPYSGLVKEITINDEVSVGSYVKSGNIYAKVVDVEKTEHGYKLSLSEEISIDDTRIIEYNILKYEHVAKLALKGIVPTKCSNINGNIYGNGELLIAGPNGCAVLAKGNYDPSSVIGKAVGKLIDDDKYIEGLVEVQL